MLMWRRSPFPQTQCALAVLLRLAGTVPFLESGKVTESARTCPGPKGSVSGAAALRRNTSLERNIQEESLADSNVRFLRGSRATVGAPQRVGSRVDSIPE